MSTLKNKIDFAVIVSVNNANPNGDPLNGNRPRVNFDGFGELFRSLTYQEIGTGCILSRAMAGIVKGKVIISLPGSLEAVKMAMERIIIPELAHLVREASR